MIKGEIAFEDEKSKELLKELDSLHDNLKLDFLFNSCIQILKQNRSDALEYQNARKILITLINIISKNIVLILRGNSEILPIEIVEKIVLDLLDSAITKNLNFEITMKDNLTKLTVLDLVKQMIVNNF